MCSGSASTEPTYLPTFELTTTLSLPTCVMTDSSPVLPNSNSSNSSSSASSKKMTKSYLLESDPILKTSSKATSSPFALSNNNNNNAEGTGGNAGNGGSGGGGHRHHHHHHQQQRSSTNWNHYQEDAAAAAAASAAIQQQLRHQHLQLQQHSIPGHDLFSDRPSVKPSLAAHHVHELNVNALCNADQPELVIDHLAKVIEAQLRDARENRRLVCKELFLPNDLLRNIAAKVRLLAEPEPCGLRGCKFYICIEDKDASALNSGNTPPATTHQSPSPVNSRLLGEVSLDRTMVPTFEVFLTLKPTLPNWFDVLESRLFGRERIIVAENYLIHKKKLYRSHDESPTSDM
ncbi:Ddit4lp [Tyrophagus putrescentiae]|nr:Ddit4lp [Tyrophagus putrescentiae]